MGGHWTAQLRREKPCQKVEEEDVYANGQAVFKEFQRSSVATPQPLPGQSGPTVINLGGEAHQISRCKSPCSLAEPAAGKVTSVKM